jgi:hypothetical protein
MTVSNIKTPAFIAAAEHAISLLRDTVPAFEALGGFPPGSLVVPEWDLSRDSSASVKVIKEFCVGLLESPSDHAWWPVLARASLEVRTSIAGSLFLFRKILPSPPAPWEAHRDRVCLNPASFPSGYLRHVRREIRSLFGTGWDSGYARVASSYAPPLSSCLESPRSRGGCRAEWRGLQAQYLSFTSGISEFPLGDSFDVRFMNVDTGGKSRSVTVASADQCLLGPLHRLIYGVLSDRCSWLLRGEAKQAKFSHFVREQGEVFVSGDYQSATDNLPLEVAEVILDVLRERALFVPDRVFDLARRSLRADVEYPLSGGGSCRFRQVRGQLMGNLLSFPLLCLQNYVAFRYCVSRSEVSDDLVRINGDDIVFRARMGVVRRWMDTVSSLGLQLCRGKTLVSASIFSLNSTFFRSRKLGPKLVPVARFQSLATLDSDYVPHSLGPGLRTFIRGFRGECRIRLEMVYLRRRGRQFAACGRSWLRDLRAPISPETLVRLGWAEREAWFLTSTPPLALPADEVRLGTGVPEGWVRVPAPTRSVRSAGAALQEEFSELLLERAWNGDPVPTKRLAREVWRKTVSSGYGSSFLWWRRCRRGRFRLGSCLPYLTASCREIGLGEPLRRARVGGFRLSGFDRGTTGISEFKLVARAFRQPLRSIFEYRAGRPVPKVWLRREEAPPRSGLGYT